MVLLLSILIFILGLIIGSGINALVYRVHSGKSFLRGRSECPECHHVLAPRDLLPVFSFLALMGKCRYCKKTIHWMYPAIELLTAVSFLLYAMFSQYVVLTQIDSSLMIARLLVGLVFISFLIFIFLYDARYMIIPNKALMVLAPIAFLGSWLVLGHPLTSVLLGAAVGFGFFGLMYALSKGKWIGFGDVKFGLVFGFMLGLSGTLMTLFFAYVIGAIFAVVILAMKKKHLQDRIAFGPFLALGAIIVLIAGQLIAQWYVGLL